MMTTATAPASVRASAADRIMACPRSAIPPEVPMDMTTAEAAEGKQIHARLATMLRADGKVLPSADGLLEYAHQAWREIEPLLPTGLPHVEQPIRRVLGDVDVTGHPDFWRDALEKAGLLDWKTGWRSEQGSCEWQLLVYAWLIGPVDMVAFGVYLRDRVYDKYEWTKEYIEARIAELVERVKNPDAHPYAPGDCCRYCPRQWECPALETCQGQIVRLIQGPAKELTPAEIVAAIQLFPALERAMKRVKGVWRRLIQNGTPIQSDTHELALQPNPRYAVDIPAGLDVLTSWFTDEQLWGIVKTSKTALAELARETAPDRSKGHAADMLIDELEQVGAITKTFGDPKLVVRKRKQET